MAFRAVIQNNRFKKITRIDGFRGGMLMLYLKSFWTLKAEKLLYSVIKCTIRDQNGPHGTRRLG